MLLISEAIGQLKHVGLLYAIQVHDESVRRSHTMADDIYRMFETAQQSSVPLMRPPGGTVYVYTWTEDDKAEDWRADGYRWRQGGCWHHKCEEGSMKKTYSKVCTNLCFELRRRSCTEKYLQAYIFVESDLKISH